MSAALALSKLGLKQMVIAALAREGITTEQQLREAGRDALSRIPASADQVSHISKCSTATTAPPFTREIALLPVCHADKKRYRDRPY